MPEFKDAIVRRASPLDLIRTLLERSTSADESLVQLAMLRNGLLQKSKETGDSLLSFSSSTAGNTEKQTSMAQERTALTREQTRLSTRSTELAHERAALSSTRTDLARERNSLAADRTDYSVRRTDLAQERTGLATTRTVRALSRTRLSFLRTEMAKERTYLALLRTGLALLTFGIVLFRYFGLSWWSLFDVALVLLSIGLLSVGVSGYVRSHRRVLKLDGLVRADTGLRDLEAD